MKLNLFLVVFSVAVASICWSQDSQPLDFDAKEPPAYGGALDKSKDLSPGTIAINEERRKKAEQQTAKYLELTNNLSSTLIDLLKQYDLTDELQLTDEQLKQLSNVRLSKEFYENIPESVGPISLFPELSVPSPALVHMILCKGEKFPIPDGEFENFETNFRSEFQRQAKNVDDQVKAILNARQFERLSQIGFQRDTIIFPDASGAFSFHGEVLTSEDRRSIQRDLARIRMELLKSKSAMQFAARLNSVGDVIGEDAAMSHAGEIYPFGNGPGWAELVRMLTSNPAPETKPKGARR